MPKAYKVTRHKIKFYKNNIHDVFSVKPVNYGTLTTSQAADQIANESSLTPGDVLNVLNRYSHYVKQNLQKGYAIELLGFGKLDIARLNRVLSKLLTDLKRIFPRALIRGHCEMPGAVPKAYPVSRNPVNTASSSDKPPNTICSVNSTSPSGPSFHAGNGGFVYLSYLFTVY